MAKLRGTSWGNLEEPVGETEEEPVGETEEEPVGETEEELFGETEGNKLRKLRGTNW